MEPIGTPVILSEQCPECESLEIIETTRATSIDSARGTITFVVEYRCGECLKQWTTTRIYLLYPSHIFIVSER